MVLGGTQSRRGNGVMSKRENQSGFHPAPYLRLCLAGAMATGPAVKGRDDICTCVCASG